MRSAFFGRALVAATLAMSAAGLVACGESAQEKAKAEVCAARKSISEQVTKLEGLTISTNTLTEAKTGFETIGKELTKIKNAQPNLEPARREQVEAATKTFQAQLSSLVSGIASSLGSGSLSSALTNAEPKLKAALTQLGNDYKSALEPISCS